VKQNDRRPSKKNGLDAASWVPDYSLLSYSLLV